MQHLHSSAPTLPVIDLGKVGSLSAQQMAADIIRACETIGFFYVVGHGMAQPRIDAALAAMQGFFALPPDIKRRYAVDSNHRGFHALGGAVMPGAAHPDQKEFFQIGVDLPPDHPLVCAGQPLRGPNQWPVEVPGFQTAMSDYFAGVAAIGEQLLRFVAIGLGADPEHFARAYHIPLQRTQGLYYPPMRSGQAAAELGLSPHTDYGCLTLLYQPVLADDDDHSGGLQVRTPDGDWIDAPPIAGSFVVNIGDLLQRWSNDRLRSTWHRVINRKAAPRYSIATFFDPDFDAVIDPADFGVAADDQGCAPIKAGDHIMGRIAESFAYRQRFATQNT